MQTVDSPSPPPNMVIKAQPPTSHPPKPHITTASAVRPLSLSTTTSSLTSVNPMNPVNSGTIAETPPTVIGPSAHLASHVTSHDWPVGHMMSHNTSHDPKDSVFSPTTDDDQMKHIEKVCACVHTCIRVCAHACTCRLYVVLVYMYMHLCVCNQHKVVCVYSTLA